MIQKNSKILTFHNFRNLLTLHLRPFRSLPLTTQRLNGSPKKKSFKYFGIHIKQIRIATNQVRIII
jgi:hypothetical protein